ncbi:MAG: hypothetical protein PHC31_07755 [Clostridia bacterium]|jgi:hypothetical protein|nr:hypothetical protein [Clostridia bacterium]
MKKFKIMFSIIMLICLLSMTALAFAGGTDSYHGYISAVAEWDADLYITANDDYAGASTTIYPVSPTNALYCQVDLYIIQRDPVTQQISAKDSHIVADYVAYGSTGLSPDSGCYIVSASTYHEAYCLGDIDSTNLSVGP